MSILSALCTKCVECIDNQFVMACRQLVKPSTLCLHLSSTRFVRILPSTRYVHPLYLYPLCLQSIPCAILIIYVCVSWGCASAIFSHVG